MAGLGFPFNLAASGTQLGIGFNGSTVALSARVVGQSFQTIPLPNSRTALYAISIFEPHNTSTPFQSFTFPLSPSTVFKEFTAMSNVYDVAGDPSEYGVHREVDIYGNSPVTYRIEGTTGWQYHSTDGYSSTGLEAIAALQDIVNQFAYFNAQQRKSGSADLYTMEFYDYFSGSYWQVVPVGPQVVRQNERRPLLFEYAFRLVGIAPVAKPQTDTSNDSILSALALSQPQAIAAMAVSNVSVLTNYKGLTAGALGITL